VCVVPTGIYSDGQIVGGSLWPFHWVLFVVGGVVRCESPRKCPSLEPVWFSSSLVLPRVVVP